MLEENELFHDGAIHSPGGYLPTCHSCFLFHVFLTQHPHPRKKRNVSMSQASREDRFLTATFDINAASVFLKGESQRRARCSQLVHS